jgi:hypothetical protein
MIIGSSDMVEQNDAIGASAARFALVTETVQYHIATLLRPTLSGDQNLHPNTVIVALAAVALPQTQNSAKSCRVYGTSG